MKEKEKTPTPAPAPARTPRFTDNRLYLPDAGSVNDVGSDPFAHDSREFKMPGQVTALTRLQM